MEEEIQFGGNTGQTGLDQPVTHTLNIALGLKMNLSTFSNDSQTLDKFLLNCNFNII